MARFFKYILLGLTLLVSTQAWSDSGLLVSDYLSSGKVVHVFLDGKVEPVFPPPSDLSTHAYDGITQVEISPSQQFIAYGLRGDIWLYDVAKKTTMRVTKVGKPYTKKFASVDAWINRWSRDSKKILYTVSAGNAEDPEGNEPDRMERKADYGVFAFDVQTDHVASIPFPGGRGEASAWLANGDFIFVENDRFVRYDPNTKSTKVISSIFGGLNGYQVDISSDETQMVFTEDSSARMKNSALVRLNMVSGKSTPITKVGNWAEFQWPKFSPSGRKISYQHRVGTSATRLPIFELVVDGKAIYSFEGNSRYHWFDESTLVLKISRSNDFELVILSTDLGVALVSKKWN